MFCRLCADLLDVIQNMLHGLVKCGGLQQQLNNLDERLNDLNNLISATVNKSNKVQYIIKVHSTMFSGKHEEAELVYTFQCNIFSLLMWQCCIFSILINHMHTCISLVLWLQCDRYRFVHGDNKILWTADAVWYYMSHTSHGPCIYYSNNLWWGNIITCVR